MLRILEHEADLEADLARKLHVFPDILAVEEHAARRRLQKPVEMLDQGRFARSGVSDQSHKFPALDGQTHIPERRTLKRGVRAVDVGQILYL